MLNQHIQAGGVPWPGGQTKAVSPKDESSLGDGRGGALAPKHTPQRKEDADGRRSEDVACRAGCEGNPADRGEDREDIQFSHAKRVEMGTATGTEVPCSQQGSEGDDVLSEDVISAMQDILEWASRNPERASDRFRGLAPLLSRDMLIAFVPILIWDKVAS